MGAEKILSVGMLLMRKMRLGSKLGIVFFVALVPLLLIVWQLLSRNMSDSQLTRSELVGVHIVEQASQVIRLVQTHRGQTNLVLLGKTAAQSGRDQTRGQLNDARGELARRVANSDPEAIPPDWKDVQNRLDGLVAQVEGKDAAQAFALHTALVADLTRFVYGVADKSGLLYDP
ncbi:MAG: hypothetical protein ACOVOD_11130, partial [Rhodoferax sp.]